MPWLTVAPQPNAGGKDFIERLNRNSLKVVQAVVEPSLAAAKADDKSQFEWHGYFVADRVDYADGRPVIIRSNKWGEAFKPLARPPRLSRRFSPTRFICRRRCTWFQSALQRGG